MKLPFKSVCAFRPGYIKPIPGLKHAFTAAKAVAPLYPLFTLLLRRYVCTLEDVGLSMVQAASNGYPKHIFECDYITGLARSNPSSST